MPETKKTPFVRARSLAPSTSRSRDQGILVEMLRGEDPNRLYA
jgi:hypothetical protein